VCNEVGNAITRRFPTQAANWLAALAKFGLLDATRSDKWLTTTLGLISRFGCTFYGAAYQAVALSHNGVFITADSRSMNLTGDADGVSLLGILRAPTNRRQR